MAEPAYVRAWRVLIDQSLEAALRKFSRTDTRLTAAMRYSLLLGGKRIRPVLAMAVANSFGTPPERAVDCLIALEMIHAYSLIHDDLPAMDDDDLRRGQPTCHKAFDEATAILAGDALQAMAFETIAAADFPDAAKRLNMIEILSRASGARGMVLGQAIDLESEARQVDLPHLQAMHGWKTGALIRASVELGALCAATPLHARQLQALTSYADAIGLAFQVQDDILDITSDTATLGKQQGADLALQKSTYPSLLGLEGAQQKLKELTSSAEHALSALSDEQAAPLLEMLHYIVLRKH